MISPPLAHFYYLHNLLGAQREGLKEHADDAVAELDVLVAIKVRARHRSR